MSGYLTYSDGVKMLLVIFDEENKYPDLDKRLFPQAVKAWI
jgi:hypothetical protein